MQGFEFAVSLPSGQAAGYLSSVLADSKPGCAAYDTLTNTGATQHVQLVRVVDVGTLGNQRYVQVVQISVQGQVDNVAEIIIRKDERMIVFVIFSPAEVSDSEVTALATRASDRLVNAP